MARILFALVNICLGGYFVYWGWMQGGVYIPAVLFPGAVMLGFGVALLFIRPKKKPPPQYKDVYDDRQ